MIMMKNIMKMTMMIRDTETIMTMSCYGYDYVSGYSDVPLDKKMYHWERKITTSSS